MSMSITGTSQPVQPAAAERLYRRRIFSWAMYDWADHGIITVFITTFFPPYFIALAAPVFIAAGKVTEAQANVTAGNIFAIALGIILLITALSSPIIGAYADLTGQRKRILILATVIGGVIASLGFTLTTGLWVYGLLIYAGTQMSVNIALGLNSSLLPHVARPDDLNRVSSLGYAMGYTGGGLILLANVILLAFADKLGLPQGLAVRIALLSSGIWWVLFMIPVIFNVPEPPADSRQHIDFRAAVGAAFGQVGHTLREIQRYRELFKMLVAFWLYSEGISSIILLATAYGKTLGLDNTALVVTILVVQFVALPYVLAFGRIPNPASFRRAMYVAMLVWSTVTLPIMGFASRTNPNLPLLGTFGLLFTNQIAGIAFSYLLGPRLFGGFASRLDTKRTVLLGLCVYLVIPAWGFFIGTPSEFFMLGWLTGTVQGGVQALSRTVYTTMTPRAQSAEFFGLYGLSEKFAGILGPLLYGIVGTLTGDPRNSIVSIEIFFLIGMVLLARVDDKAGARVALEADERLAVGGR
ncbi:MAG TPA: MFS transporter [Aggregatilineaceae bacterium]|nr:MFS transporter [Aggregatilineaceae bacterium]